MEYENTLQACMVTVASFDIIPKLPMSLFKNLNFTWISYKKKKKKEEAKSQQQSEAKTVYFSVRDIFFFFVRDPGKIEILK